jgi:hypothetical protein
MKTSITKITLIAAFVFSAFSSNAQKVYATKTGQTAFNASSPIEKIAAVNNQTDSKFVGESGQVVFAVLVKGFKFENQLMEDHFNENYMESTQFPNATFKGNITNPTEVNFAKDGAYTAKLSGTMNMHGVEKPANIIGKVTVKGGIISIHADFAVSAADYNIPIPSVVSDKIAKSIDVKVDGTLKPMSK